LEQLQELRGDAIIYVLDSATSNDALGFHTRNLSGIPYGLVYLDLCKELGDNSSTTLSHEALELIGDPQCNLLDPHMQAAALAANSVIRQHVAGRLKLAGCRPN
jgi:hypothetical protein